jgi:hypothetical protein
LFRTVLKGGYDEIYSLFKKEFLNMVELKGLENTKRYYKRISPLAWSNVWIDTIGKVISKVSSTTFCKFVNVIEARSKFLVKCKDILRLLMVYRISTGEFPEGIDDDLLMYSIRVFLN